MPDWLKIIADHHAKAHRDDGFSLVTRPGASTTQLDELAAKLGIEFRELYSACDGFGVAGEDDSDAVWWLFRPANEVAQFTEDVRSWFTDTHRKYADRLYTFIDFSNGDGIGYVADENGGILDGLFCFEHESYKFDKDQDVNEFITYTPITIEEFLLQSVG